MKTFHEWLKKRSTRMVGGGASAPGSVRRDGLHLRLEKKFRGAKVITPKNWMDHGTVEVDAKGYKGDSSDIKDWLKEMGLETNQYKVE